MSCFLDNQDDATKMLVFVDDEYLWSDIKEIVKAYTLSNWERWDLEKPAWFDENFRASVGDEFIPPAALAKLNKMAAGGKRRRSSHVLILVGDGDGGEEARVAPG